MKTTSKTTPKTRECKGRAKAMQKQGTPGEFGHLTSEETTFLVMLAQEALAYQIALRNFPSDTNFDAWRRHQVEIETGLAGISKINRSHVRDVAGRFFGLAGQPDKELEYRLKTGKKTDHCDPSNTWESCETYVHHIREALTNHAQATVTHPKGHLHAGWLIAAARQRTGKHTLTMATLAERLDPPTLAGLRDHLISHINLREGRAKPERRSARVYPEKPDPCDFEPDPF